MSKTESTMLPLGTIAPNFELDDVTSGSRIKLNDSQNRTGTVLMFLCNHCPYVKHINSGITQLSNDYLPKKIRFIAISSNDVNNHPEDSPDNMIQTARDNQYPFPYLFDETQEVAMAYNAACTPDFYVYNDKLALIYRGQFDDSKPGNTIPVTGSSIRNALEYLINKTPLNKIQKPSLGCSIKWK